VLVVFLGWVALSISWSISHEIGFYRFLKLFEMVGLWLFLTLNPRCSTRAKLFHVEHSAGQAWDILKVLLFWGVANSLIGIGQFVLQHSVGLFWLRESFISPDIAGVAKVIFGGAKYIRIYGLFPHPNILGGFMLMSILGTLAAKNVSPCQECSTWNILRGKRETFWWVILGIQVVGLILTFSKAAMLGLILAIGYLWLRNVSRGTGLSKIMPSLRQIESHRVLSFVFFGLVLGTIGIMSHPDVNAILFQSLRERGLYLSVAWNMIQTHWFHGVGIGQFVPNMSHFTNLELFDWQFQPVHNVFLLAWSELGLVGFGLFIVWLWNIWQLDKNVPPLKECSTWNIPRGKCGTILGNSEISAYFKAILLGFTFIALFDHYFWDLQQGQIMLWLVLGLLGGYKSTT